MTQIADPVVLLATNSPLYAPVYLAKILKPSWRDVRLEYSNPPRIEENPESSRWLRDPFTEALLSPAEKTRGLLMGVGDPMRLVWARTSVSREPLVIGSLIKTMCYWIIASRSSNYLEADTPLSRIDKLITHPVGTTGYTLPIHHILNGGKNQGVSVEDLYDSIKRKCVDDGVLGNERQEYYRSLKDPVKRKKSQGRGEQVIAYVTPDPLHAMLAEGDAEELENARLGGLFSRVNRPKTYRSREYMLVDFPGQYNSVVMTGFITQKTLWERNGRYREKMKNMMRELREIMQLIDRYPSYCALLLAGGHGDYEKDPFDGWEPLQIHRFFRNMEDWDAYNLKLRVDDVHWDNSKKIVESAVDFVQSQASPGRKVLHVPLKDFDKSYYLNEVAGDVGEALSDDVALQIGNILLVSQQQGSARDSRYREIVDKNHASLAMHRVFTAAFGVFLYALLVYSLKDPTVAPVMCHLDVGSELSRHILHLVLLIVSIGMVEVVAAYSYFKSEGDEWGGGQSFVEAVVAVVSLATIGATIASVLHYRVVAADSYETFFGVGYAVSLSMAFVGFFDSWRRRR